MKIILLTNILTPYRKHFFDTLHTELKNKGIQFIVLVMAETEPGRQWKYNDFKTEYTRLLNGKTISLKKSFIHISFGYKNLLKKLEPDLLIASGSYIFPSVWTSIRLKNKLNYKLIFWSESHLNETRNYSKIIYKIRETIRQKIYKRFDGFWFAGALSKKLIEQYASQDSKYIFVPNLIKEEVYYQANILRKDKDNLRKKWGVSLNKFVFICPARLEPVKGILPFLNLLKETKISGDVTILIAGEGQLKKDIFKYSQAEKLDVRLLGSQTEKNLIELYALSDSFLLPSLSDANPLTSIEAVWAGLPLLVSEHVGNHPETIKSNKNGYVFSYSDSRTAISLIEKIVFSSQEWRYNANKISVEIANQIYNTNTSVTKIIDQIIKL